MQNDIDLAFADAGIQILGVNEIGQNPEGANELACEGRDIPWLQEDEAFPIWEPWAITWRDVVILDEENLVVGIYNLTEHNLSVAENYAALESMLLAAAGLAAPRSSGAGAE